MSDMGADVARPATQFCSACGGALNLGVKFCGGCGKPVGAESGVQNSTAAQSGTESGSESGQSDVMSLTKAWVIYMVCIAAIALLTRYLQGYIVFLYLAIGIYMSRGVMRRLIEWHPMHNTLANVTSAKLWMVFLWPFNMLSLLFRLSVNRVL